MKVRIKFRKEGPMRFVGHLDFMRYFQRAMRRAGMELSYSEGFSPHPLMSFAQPLGIGLTSGGEYVDVSVSQTLPSYDACERLNWEMVEGVTVTEYLLLPEGVKKAMASVSAADYFVYFKHAQELTSGEISDGITVWLTERKRVEVKKQTKKGESVIDIKPFIYEMQPCEDNEDASLIVPPVSDLTPPRGFFLRLATGSAQNIRPETVLADFYRFLGRDYDPFHLQIHRIDLYENASSGFDRPVFVPLSAAGEEIPL